MKNIFLILVPSILYVVFSGFSSPEYSNGPGLGDTTVLSKKDGNMVKLVQLNNRLRQQLYYTNGVLVRSFCYLMVDTGESYFEEDSTFVRAIAHGPEIKYLANGDISFYVEYVNGRTSGLLYEKDSLGFLILEIYYDTSMNEPFIKWQKEYSRGDLQVVSYYTDSSSRTEVISQKGGAPLRKNGMSGKSLFESSNCGACHGLDEKLLGPALRGIVKKEGRDFVFNYIKNNMAFRQTNKRAQEVYKENSGAAMPIFEGMLSDDDIHAIVDYLESGDQ
jgi:mono/diheme cytochrome c family protein